MAILGISHSGIELIGTTNWILIEAFQFLEGIFNKFQTAWSLNTDWPSFQKCGKLPTLTDQWLEQSHCPPKKSFEQDRPWKNVEIQKEWLDNMLYIICKDYMYIWIILYIYMYIKNILGVTFLPAKGLILVLQKWLMYFPVTRRWLENAPEMDGWMSSQKGWNWRQEIARQQLLTRNLPQQHAWKHHRSSKQNTHTHKKIQNLTGDPKLGSNLCNKRMLFVTQKGQWETMPQSSISRSLGLLFRKALERLQTTLRSVPYVIDIQ